MREKGSMISEFKPWGRWATLGLGLIALFGGQIVALIPLLEPREQRAVRMADLMDRLLLGRCLPASRSIALLVQASGQVRRYRFWIRRPNATCFSASSPSQY